MRMKVIPEQQGKLIVFTIAFMLIGFVLPWWSILILATYIGWRERSLPSSLKVAFLACFIAWFLLSLGFDAASGFKVSVRLGGLIKMPIPVVANLITGIVGGLLAAVVSATANQLRATINAVKA